MTQRRLISLRQIPAEPYRVYFFLGALLCIVGTAFWPLLAYSKAFAEIAPSTKFHVWIQIYGFMTCFVFGFLGTAIPHFTKARHLSWAELLLLLALHAAVLVFLARSQYREAHFAYLAMILAFVAMLGVRVVGRRQTLPDSFVLIPFAFVALISGCALQLSIYLGLRWRVVELSELSQNLIFQGFISFLIMGVGGFLVRAIFGWPQFPGQKASIKLPHLPPALPRSLHLLCGVVLLVSFPIESFAHARVGLFLRALVVSVEVFGQLRVHRKPTSGRSTARWIRWAMILLALGFWGVFVAPGEYRLPFLHLCFAGGFGITTFCVATWVIFNHGGCAHLLAEKYRPLTVTLVLFSIALACRLPAEFLESVYESHLAYAGIFWAAGVIVWCFTVLIKALFYQPVEEDIRPR